MNKKELIFRTAAHMFIEKGYTSTSIRELAIKVDLEPSSIYSHVKSKEALLSKIYLNSAQKFVARINAISEDKDSPKDKLKKLINFHIDLALFDSTKTIVFSDEWKHLSRESLSEFLILKKYYEKGFVAILNNGKEQGAFREINTDIMMHTIVSSTRWLHYQKKYRSKKLKKKLREQILKLIMKGVVK